VGCTVLILCGLLFSAFSWGWSCSVAGFPAWLGVTRFLMSLLHVAGVCWFMGTLRVRSLLLDGSCCVRCGAFHWGIHLNRIPCKKAVSHGENIQLGRLLRRLRSHVLLAKLHYRISQLVALFIVISYYTVRSKRSRTKAIKIKKKAGIFSCLFIQNRIH